MKNDIQFIHGENPTFGGNQLFIDLIPRQCWFSSIRTSLIKSDWDRLRKFVYQRAGNCCQCCKSTQKLEGHERWFYDKETKTQKLMRIIALCQKCHLVTHFGRAQCIGYAEQAKQHLMKVRNWSLQQFQNHKRQAFQLWRQRNKTVWKLDLTIIKENGLRLCKKMTGKQKNNSESEIGQKPKEEKSRSRSREKKPKQSD